MACGLSTMHTAPLLPEAPCERDWQALAWQRMTRQRLAHPGWSLDDALREPTVGRVLRLFAAQLARDAEILAQHAERAARYGTPVRHNGFGYVPVPAPTSTTQSTKITKRR